MMQRKPNQPIAITQQTLENIRQLASLKQSTALGMLLLVTSAMLLTMSASILAKENNASGAIQVKSTVLYISPNEYNHSVRLLHPYYDYWFAQGPLVEPIVLNALQSSHGDVALCKANETAEQVIRVKPSLFYNPQSRIFYSRLAATVYSSSGEQLASYIGEGQQQGYMAVNHAITMHLNKAYGAAMADLTQKMAAGKTTDAKVPLASNQLANATTLPCGLIGAQAEPRIGFY